MRLGRKQSIPDQHVWQAALAQAQCRAAENPGGVDALIERSVDAIRAQAKIRRVGFAWSGGKDSQVLAYLMDLAKVDDCVIGLTRQLEWPAMRAWIQDHMPLGCRAIIAPLDLAWLAKHPKMLFPQGRYGSAWFKLVKHEAQARFFHAEALDLLAVARRRADGNYVGALLPDGGGVYTAGGVTRWSPLAGWTHEQVLSVIAHKRIALPPCYGWPRGFQVGVGPWPARQFTTGHDQGWAECWQIDAQLVVNVAAWLPSAADWMARTGKVG